MTHRTLFWIAVGIVISGVVIANIAAVATENYRIERKHD